MAQPPGRVLMTRLRRLPNWMRSVLALEDDQIPEGVFLPGIVPTVNILDVASRPVFPPAVALAAGAPVQLPDIPCAVFGLLAPAANAPAIVLIGDSTTQAWEIAPGGSLFLSLANPNLLQATVDAGVGNVVILALQPV